MGKRSRNAEMERELIELRRQLGSGGQNSPESSHPPPLRAPSGPVETPSAQHVPLRHDHYMGSEDVITSLLDLKQGLNGGGYVEHIHGPAPGTRTLESVAVSGDRIVNLFHQYVHLSPPSSLPVDDKPMLIRSFRYFTYYHPFLPLLDPSKPPDYYYSSSQLLFWTVLSIASRRYALEPTLLDSLAPAVSRLIWSSLREIPQNYHVVKALCLLCTWPFPISTTSADPTFMLSGVMMHVAMQIGLHRPSYAQDFARYQVQLRDEDLRDRVRTWAACNIVSQWYEPRCCCWCDY